MNHEDTATLIFLEALKTRREGMVAENEHRKWRGESQAHDEADFYSLEVEIRNLLSRC
jgi:hypothetical protein